MTWNYRVIKHLATDPDNSLNEDYVGLYEVYYNEDGSITSRTKDAIITGDSLEEILETLEMIEKDVTNKPLLIESEVTYEGIELERIDYDL